MVTVHTMGQAGTGTHPRVCMDLHYATALHCMNGGAHYSKFNDLHVSFLISPSFGYIRSWLHILPHFL